MQWYDSSIDDIVHEEYELLVVWIEKLPTDEGFSLLQDLINQERKG